MKNTTNLQPADGAATRRAELAEDGLMDVKEACEFLKVKQAFLYELLSEGKITSLKLGRRRLIPRRALTELIAKQLEAAGT